MNEITTTWNREEFFAYLLTFAVQADFRETQEEADFVKLKVAPEILNRIKAEFEADTEFTRAQKIQYTVEKLGFSGEDTDQILKEIEDLFKADGKYDMLERNAFIGLKRMLK